MSTVQGGDLSLSALREGYRDGSLTPVTTAGAVLARIAERGEDAVWISRVPTELLLARAAALDRGQLNRLPLYGVPFAVKDNIDVAGLETTAACPAFGYRPDATAPMVQRLLDAGGLLVGKANLDQFATGLNGTRSPYGAPGSAFDPSLISGGSSSGSAVAVASGLVSFALGTDTAGSGRVPAALNNVVGMKPSVGLVDGSGMVAACRSLDCPSVFALTVADGASVLSVMTGNVPTAEGPPPAPRPAGAEHAELAGLRLAVPAAVDGWGTRGEAAAWADLCRRLVDAGVRLLPVDMSPFFEAGDQLYGGAWIAERLAGLEAFLSRHPDQVLPVIHEVLAGAGEVRGADVFTAQARMRELAGTAAQILARVDALLTPTVTTTFTIAQMRADPVRLNSALGRWTSFTNLLDLCAVAVPAGLTDPGLPFGVTVQAPSGRDERLAAVAGAVERMVGARPGAPRPARSTTAGPRSPAPAAGVSSSQGAEARRC